MGEEQLCKTKGSTDFLERLFWPKVIKPKAG